MGVSWEGLVTCGKGRGTKKNLDAFLAREGGGERRIRIINLVTCGNS